jgi:hypothetical protein
MDESDGPWRAPKEAANEFGSRLSRKVMSFCR